MMTLFLLCLVFATVASALRQDEILLHQIPVIATLVRANIHHTSDSALATIFRTAANGLNFDHCEAERECAGARLCLSADSLGSCSAESTCICAPTTSAPCSSSGDCDDGESCGSSLLFTGTPICVSDAVITLFNDFTEVEDGIGAHGDGTPLPPMESPTPDYETPTPNVEFPPFREGQGLNFERCFVKQDCASGRGCFGSDITDDESCKPPKDCLCLRSPRRAMLCNTSNECDAGESCATVRGASKVAFCVSDIVITDLGIFIVDNNSEKGKKIYPKF